MSSRARLANAGLVPEARQLFVDHIFLHPALPDRVYAQTSQQVFGARF